jgi:zinc protease
MTRIVSPRAIFYPLFFVFSLGFSMTIVEQLKPTTAHAAPARVQVVTSPSGIKAWLVEDHTLPLIAINFAFRGGASQDPADKPGVASLTAAVLDEGAGEFDSLSFQTALEDASVRLSFDASKDAFYGQINALSPELNEAVRLARLALLEPRFDQEPFERMIARTKAQLRNELRDPDAIASRLTSQTLFPDHAYASPVDGNLETLDTITIEDLKAFHQTKLAKDNLIVGVVGTITPQALELVLDELFGALPDQADLKTIPTIAPQTGILVEEKEDVPQTVIRFIGPAPLRLDEDFLPAFVANHILGGGVFSSRLFRQVREERGLAYSVYTYLGDFDHTGLYAGGVSTRAERANEALDVILSAIKDFAEDGPTDEELTEAKQFLTGSYPLRFDTSGKIARQLAELQLARLDRDYMEKRNDLINAITLDEVKAVAQKMYSVQPTIIKVGQIQEEE